MNQEEKLEKVTHDFSLLNEEQQDYIIEDCNDMMLLTMLNEMMPQMNIFLIMIMN